MVWLNWELNTLISFLYSVSSLRLNHTRIWGRKCCTSDRKRFLLSISWTKHSKKIPLHIMDQVGFDVFQTKRTLWLSNNCNAAKIGAKKEINKSNIQFLFKLSLSLVMIRVSTLQCFLKRWCPLCVILRSHWATGSLAWNGTVASVLYLKTSKES